MGARWTKISAAARKALTEHARYEGPLVTITEQLTRDGWMGVKTVLEKLGAVYVVGGGAFEFEPDQDAEQIVEAALTAGKVMGAASADGFVATPAQLAADLVERYGEVTHVRGRKLRVLEPSAGTGRFVAAVRERLGPEWCDITAVEPDVRRARQIPTDEAITVHVGTVEDFVATSPEPFDVVVMNPPFSVPNRPTIWADHLLAAWGLLEPGGRLLAIVPASVLYTARGREGLAAELVKLHGGSERLEPGAFKESGTLVAAVAVWADRPLTGTPAVHVAPPHPYVFRAYRGDEPAAPVSRLYLSRAAAEMTPVQGWRDAWRGDDLVLRYVADCAVCGLPTWLFDGTDNDVRGPLGQHSAAWSLDPGDSDYSEGLPSVALCVTCADSQDTYKRGMALAQQFWADAEAWEDEEPETPAADLAVAAPQLVETQQVALFELPEREAS